MNFSLWIRSTTHDVGAASAHPNQQRRDLKEAPPNPLLSPNSHRQTFMSSILTSSCYLSKNQIRFVQLLSLFMDCVLQKVLRLNNAASNHRIMLEGVRPEVVTKLEPQLCLNQCVKFSMLLSLSIKLNLINLHIEFKSGLPFLVTWAVIAYGMSCALDRVSSCMTTLRELSDMVLNANIRRGFQVIRECGCPRLEFASNI